MINITRIKDIREDNDLTQEQMSNILHVSRGAYSLWEIGVSIIPLNYLSDFADYFNLSIDYVLGLTNNRNIKTIKGLDFIKLGNNIKSLRIKNNLSQAALSKMLNVSQACIVRWEKAQIKITVSNLYKISKLFKIPLNDLCGKTYIPAKTYVTN